MSKPNKYHASGKLKQGRARKEPLQGFLTNAQYAAMVEVDKHRRPRPWHPPGI